MTEPRSEDVTKKNPAELGKQIVEAIRALENLVQLGVPENNARNEGKWQLYRLAQAISELAENNLSDRIDNESMLKDTWQLLQTELLQIVEQVGQPSTEEVEAEMPSLSEEDIARRLGTAIPPHLRVESFPREIENAKRRIVIASVEPGDSTALLVNQATLNFSKETWNVTNLGANVPILALIGTVMETKPGVLALVFNKGILLQETIRLVADLKLQLFGIKIIAVGPILNQAPITNRLGADLYSSDVTRTAELAEQFFSPLNKLGNQLELSVDLTESEVTPETANSAGSPETAEKQTMPKKKVAEG